jgi:glycosyltransferase involved in cell wall biosynthesis
MDHNANSSSPGGPHADFDKPRVLVFLSFYLPAYKAGGPIRSISNLVAALGGEFRFRVATRDRDLGDTDPFPGIVPDCWTLVGDTEVHYLPPGLKGLPGIWTMLRAVDRNTVLYLNSFFDRNFSMFPALLCWLRLCRPRCLVLAPRGEFSFGALNLKNNRKAVFIAAARVLGIYNKVLWHASTNLEIEDIDRRFDTCSPGASSRVFAALDMVAPAASQVRKTAGKQAGQLKIVFVGRCSPMKNLAEALRLLHGLPGDVSFDVYGPVEDLGYQAECQQIIDALPPNIRVNWRGQVEHNQVEGIFAAHHLFLLPTLGENFGHVISEALSAGCPVLISDQTPWRNLEAERVGWDIPLDQPERFHAVLRECVEGDQQWFSVLSENATKYAFRKASDPEILKANRRLFQEASRWPDNQP